MNKTYAIGGLVAIVLVAVILGVLFLFPAGPKVYEIELREFSFASKGGSFPIKVKTGEPVVFKCINRGVVVHEFMVVTDKDGIVSLASQALMELRNTYGDDMDSIEASYEMWHHMIHEERKDLIILSADIEPGKVEEVQITFDKPGVYWIVCLEIDATFPDTHAHQGMYAQIIVE